MTEARVTPGSAMVGKTLRELASLWKTDVTVTGVVRDKTQRQAPFPDTVLRQNESFCSKVSRKRSNGRSRARIWSLKARIARPAARTDR